MAETHSPKPVLVVDDENVIRTVLSETLEYDGFEVQTAEAGAEAIELLEAGGFGVAILDKNLPGKLSGLDILHRAKEISPLTRVIILTGFPSKDSAVAALKDGAFDYLEKPIDNDLLSAQVRRAWDSYALAVEREELFRKYETLFEIVPGIVWFMTEEGVMKRINREGAAMLGYNPTELLGQRYHMLLPPNEESRSSHWTFKERRTGPRATRRQVVELRTRTGATKLFEMNATGAWDRLVQESGKRFWGTLGVGWDITEHAALEEQLQQARKMEAIGRLAGGVAHDFNNLLSVILNNAEFLKADLGPEDERQPDVVEIERAALRGAELTKQLLAFSRKQVVSPQPTDVEVVVREIEPLLCRLIGEDIVLEFVHSGDLAMVQIDPSQLEQVIINLAVNARDAMTDGGRLSIQTSNVVLDQEFAASHLDVTPGDYVMLAVSDTGHGMTPEVREHLFEPFYTTKGIGRGTGLGMATVYGIVMQSGGHISVYSEAETGTSVKVYLPTLEEDSRSARAAPVGGATTLTGRENVLVVEDEDMVRRLARRVLERHGYQVTEAANGVEAVEVARGKCVDVLLTDMVMPRMSGAELAVELRRSHPEIKVVYMSGYVGNISARHNMLDDALYLQKPFTGLGLLQTLRRVIDE